MNLQVVHLTHLVFLLFYVITSSDGATTSTRITAIIIAVALALITVAVERGITADTHSSAFISCSVKERVPFDDQITQLTITVHNLDRLFYSFAHFLVKLVLCGHVRLLQLGEDSRHEICN